MLKRLRLPMLALGTVLALASPMSAFAGDHHREWREHHHHVRVYVGPAYPVWLWLLRLPPWLLRCLGLLAPLPLPGTPGVPFS